MANKFMLIRVDASPKIGFGHFMRTLALAQAWVRRGNHVIFLSKNLPDSLIKDVCGGIIDVIDDVGTIKDAVSTGLTALEVGAACIVVDGYQFDAAYQEVVSSFGITQLFIDDVGHCDYYTADIILNQNIHADRQLYKNSLPNTIFLIRPNYIMLREQFRCQQNNMFLPPPVASTILVTLGGSASGDLTRKIIINLLSLEVPGLNIITATKIDNMAKIMSSVDAAISGGGITVWELAYMGIPSICVSRGQHEETLIAAAADQNIVINGGSIEKVGTRKFKKTIQKLISDPMRRSELSQNGQTLIDGKGAERVIDVILENIKYNVE